MKTQVEKQAEIYIVAIAIVLALLSVIPIALVSWYLGIIGNGTVTAATAIVVFIYILISEL